jgi:hypothetical protein
MPSGDPLTNSLTPELRRFIAAQVVAGCGQTASEVVRAGRLAPIKADPPRVISGIEPLRPRVVRKG